MAERTAVEKAVLAALEREPAVKLHRWPVQIEYNVVNRALTLEGEVYHIIAKRRAYECVSRVDGVDGIMDRLRVRPHPDFHFPICNPETRKVEVPIVAERGTYYRDIAVLAAPADGIVNPAAIMDLTGKMGADGRIKLDLPVGKWRVYRFGHTTKGISVQPAQWEAAGLECDKSAVRR